MAQVVRCKRHSGFEIGAQVIGLLLGNLNQVTVLQKRGYSVYIYVYIHTHYGYLN